MNSAQLGGLLRVFATVLALVGIASFGYAAGTGASPTTTAVVGMILMTSGAILAVLAAAVTAKRDARRAALSILPVWLFASVSGLLIAFPGPMAALVGFLNGLPGVTGSAAVAIFQLLVLVGLLVLILGFLIVPVGLVIWLGRAWLGRRQRST